MLAGFLLTSSKIQYVWNIIHNICHICVNPSLSTKVIAVKLSVLQYQLWYSKEQIDGAQKKTQEISD